MPMRKRDGGPTAASEISALPADSAVHAAVENLFKGWQETIIWSCLQGVMGGIYTDSREADFQETDGRKADGRDADCRDADCRSAGAGEDPAQKAQTALRAAAVLGDFCFLAGEPSSAFAAERRADFGRYALFVPQNKGWETAIEAAFGSRAKKITRYATQKTAAGFDRQKLRQMAEAVPPAYAFRLIDEALFQQCLAESWCRDFVSQYRDYEMFERLGLGVVLTERETGAVVSGASAYSAYIGGIEIEVDTREDFRRRGFAAACCARLILECLDRGIYPSWDAHTEASLALAEKLGYRAAQSYTAYEISE